MLSLSSGSAALANEFDLLSSPTPTKNYIIDDAGVLNRTTKKGLSEELNKLEVRPGKCRRLGMRRGLCALVT